MSDDKTTADRVTEALAGIKYPGFARDIGTLGVLAGVELDQGRARVTLRLPGDRTSIPPELQAEIERTLSAHGLAATLAIWKAPEQSAPQGTPAPSPSAEASELPDVRAVLAVSSAKGGVGKSTVATNLASAFAASGLATGLLDADVYGPSLPILMGTADRPTAAGGKRFHPVSRHGVKCMSMGFFLDESSPVIWRGPMVAGLVQQFLGDCVWGPLDVLVIDLPPGTGDAQLTLAQRVRLSGALIVTTPQEVALRDVLRGVAMFRQVQVPVLGVVENMSSFHCPHCGQEEELFGHGGGSRVAERAGVPLLARVPLLTEVRTQGDRGEPIVLADPGSDVARIFIELASTLAGRMGITSATQPSATA